LRHGDRTDRPNGQVIFGDHRSAGLADRAATLQRQGRRGGRVIAPLTVMLPLLASPILIVPAVTWSSSVSVNPRVAAPSAPPTAMAVPFSDCRNVAVEAPASTVPLS